MLFDWYKYTQNLAILQAVLLLLKDEEYRGNKAGEAHEMIPAEGFIFHYKQYNNGKYC